jgi:hypothetical protein
MSTDASVDKRLAVAAGEEENELTVEEKLKLREEKKRELKAQLEADKTGSSSPASQLLTDAPPPAEQPPSGAPVKRSLQRSTQSILHLKVIVETQVEDIENASKKVGGIV